MFGISGFELFIIVVAIFVLFGPEKLPEIIKISGKAIKKFKAAKAEMDQVLKDEVIDPVMKEANSSDETPKLETEAQKIKNVQEKVNLQNDNAQAQLKKLSEKESADKTAKDSLETDAQDNLEKNNIKSSTETQSKKSSKVQASKQKKGDS